MSCLWLIGKIRCLVNKDVILPAGDSDYQANRLLSILHRLHFVVKYGLNNVLPLFTDFHRIVYNLLQL